MEHRAGATGNSRQEAIIGVTFAAAWYGLGWRHSPPGFDLLFVLTITAPVQVFASLIVPALVSDGRDARGLLIGITGYALGLTASGPFDLPPGAAVVLALIAVAAATSPFKRDRHA